MTDRFPQPLPSRPRTPTANALAALRAVGRLGRGCTAQEVRAELRMPATTAYRILNALVADGYLKRTADLRGYDLGAEAAALAADVAPPVVTAAARATIERCRARIRFGVHLIQYRAQSLTVADEDADHPLGARAGLGALNASAAGKLLLAQSPDWRTLNGTGVLRRVTPATIVDPGGLDDDLEATRERGFAVAVEELRAGLACIAVPLPRPHGSVGGSLCVAGPADRVKALTELVCATREAAAELAPLLY